MRGADKIIYIQTKQDVKIIYEQFKYNLEDTQQLTCWLGFHKGISVVQRKLRKHLVTHSLDRMS